MLMGVGRSAQASLKASGDFMSGTRHEALDELSRAASSSGARVFSSPTLEVADGSAGSQRHNPTVRADSMVGICSRSKDDSRIVNTRSGSARSAPSRCDESPDRTCPLPW